MHRSASASAAASALLCRKPSRDYYECIRADPTDRAMVLKATAWDRHALLHAIPDIRRDREVVLSAVRFCGDSLLLSPLKTDREVVLAAVRALGDSLRYADKSMRKDKEVVVAAVQSDGLALRYAVKRLQDDPEVVQAAVRQNGRALRWASERLRKDLDTVMAALATSNNALAYVISEKSESAYGVSPDGCVLFQPLEPMTAESQWVQQSSRGVRSITIDGANIYAVGEDFRIYRQILVLMTPESKWIGPLSCDEVSSIAITDGFIYGVRREDKRVYKQVLCMLSPENRWDGPVSDEKEVDQIYIHGDQVFGICQDGEFFQQNVFSMCNISVWNGPLSKTLKVRSLAIFGAGVEKLFAVSTADGRIYWQDYENLHPARSWTLTSGGCIDALAICYRDLKDASQDMLEADWRAKGAHLERRAAAAHAREPG